MSEALAILEAETPKSLLKRAVNIPPDEQLKAIGFHEEQVSFSGDRHEWSRTRNSVKVTVVIYYLAGGRTECFIQGDFVWPTSKRFDRYVHNHQWHPEKCRLEKEVEEVESEVAHAYRDVIGGFEDQGVELVNEAENPKSLLRSLAQQPFGEFLADRGFRKNHRRWWEKATPYGPAQLRGVMWVEYLTEHGSESSSESTVGWLRIIYHLVRPDRTVWSTWKFFKPDVPVEVRWQTKVRMLLHSLVRDLDSAVSRAAERQLGASDTDLTRRELSQQVAKVFRTLEDDYEEMVQERNNEPI